MDEDLCYLDSPAFAEYCLKVRKVVHANEGLWLAHIHRELGDEAQPRDTLDALQSLISIGEVAESWTLPTRYLPATPKPPKVYEYNNNPIAPPSDRTNPYGLLEDKRRTTA